MRNNSHVATLSNWLAINGTLENGCSECSQPVPNYILHIKEVVRWIIKLQVIEIPVICEALPRLATNRPHSASSVSVYGIANLLPLYRYMYTDIISFHK